MGKEGETIYL